MRALRPLLAFAALGPISFASRAAAPAATPGRATPPTFAVLTPDPLRRDVERFNAMAPETVVNVVPNAEAAAWMTANVPLFTCPDPMLEEIYYFRWWSMRKHLIRTPQGFAFTEFLQKPDPISSAVGHHVMEGRWLRDRTYLDDYIRFWLRGGPGGTLNPRLHNFSEWLPDAVYQRYLVSGDRTFTTGELADLVRDYAAWEKERQLPTGLFWQLDVRDAMEESISGSRNLQNVRPPLNSYMYGNARAIAAIARLAGRDEVARTYDAKADTLRREVEASLWDPAAKFFKVRLEALPGTYTVAKKGGKNARASLDPTAPRYTTLSDAREEIGFIPWYFQLPEPGHGYEAAWAQFTDDSGFHAPWGITTAERRHPKFRSHGLGTCEWDGAVWPYATSQTLTALANVLRDYRDAPVTNRDWFDAFLTYARSQHDAEGRPYIGEYLDEKTGGWIKVKDGERSRYYHHSTFADLLITGAIGLVPRADDTVELSPLLPAGAWDWFGLDGVAYHGRLLTILWDRTGEHFHRGAGLTLLADGRVIGHADTLTRLTASLR